jgi:hypothetical protein
MTVTVIIASLRPMLTAHVLWLLLCSLAGMLPAREPPASLTFDRISRRARVAWSVLSPRTPRASPIVHALTMGTLGRAAVRGRRIYSALRLRCPLPRQHAP